jgi:hypothetical protein
VTSFAVDDRIRAIDQAGELPPVNGSVIQVSRFYVFVWYDRNDRIRMGLPARAEAFYRDSGWQAWDSEDRWRLQLVRTCAWCGHDISGPGEAHPLMYARISGDDNWNCADRNGCLRRQDILDAQYGMPSLIEVWKFPVAMLEAAS